MPSFCHNESLAAAVKAVTDHLGPKPVELAIVLGSGLGGLVDALEDAASWAYGDLACFPGGAVTGHAGRLFAGTLNGRRTLVFQGRFHLYQGLTAWQATLPVRLAHALGCRRLLLTNAVGGIHPDLVPGRFMYVADHLNFLGDNPLRGLENAFIDLTRLYRTDLFAGLERAALGHGIPLLKGILAALQGPSYETPAEIRALRVLGADAVSMSLVPEAIMGAFLGMEVVGLSFAANRAAGLGEEPLAHEDVLGAGRFGAADLKVLVAALIPLWFA